MKSNEKFTQRAEIAIEAARTAAGELGHAYIGTEHLLLGIMEEEDGLGAHILRRQGLEKEHLRRIIARDVGMGCPGAPGLGLTPNARFALEQAARRPTGCTTAASARSTCCWVCCGCRSAGLCGRLSARGLI